MSVDFERAVLQSGLDDWVPLRVVEELVARASPGSEEAVQRATLELVRSLAKRRLVSLGTVAEGTFEPWELSPDEAIARFETRSRTLSSAARGFALWLDNTAAGDALVIESLPTME
jgi:hypothetical protein